MEIFLPGLFVERESSYCNLQYPSANPSPRIDGASSASLAFTFAARSGSRSSQQKGLDYFFSCMEAVHINDCIKDEKCLLEGP